MRLLVIVLHIAHLFGVIAEAGRLFNRSLDIAAIEVVASIGNSRVLLLQRLDKKSFFNVASEYRLEYSTARTASAKRLGSVMAIRLRVIPCGTR